MKRAFIINDVWFSIFGILIFTFGVLGYLALFAGNQWYSDESVLKSLKLHKPGVIEVVSLERNIFRKSLLHIKFQDLSRERVLLDSNILMNYHFSDVK